MGGDPAAVPPVPVDQLGGNGGGRGQLIDQTQPGELADGVAGQPDRSANLGQLGGLLKHVGLQAALAEREAEGQPSDTSSDNADTQDGHGHSLLNILALC